MGGEPVPVSLQDRLSARLDHDAEAGSPRAEAGRPAAVLALVAMVADEPSILLMERAAALRRHAGQPALPGGARDARDGTLWDTAVREAGEEAGVRDGGIRRLGRLPSLYITVSGFRVTPWVAAAVLPVFPEAEVGEVAKLFWVPVHRLRAVQDSERIPGRGNQLYRVFPLPEEGVRVWGATAWILDQLLRRWPQDDASGS